MDDEHTLMGFFKEREFDRIMPFLEEKIVGDTKRKDHRMVVTRVLIHLMEYITKEGIDFDEQLQKYFGKVSDFVSAGHGLSIPYESSGSASGERMRPQTFLTFAIRLGNIQMTEFFIKRTEGTSSNICQPYIAAIRYHDDDEAMGYMNLLNGGINDVKVGWITGGARRSIPEKFHDHLAMRRRAKEKSDEGRMLKLKEEDLLSSDCELSDFENIGYYASLAMSSDLPSRRRRHINYDNQDDDEDNDNSISSSDDESDNDDGSSSSGDESSNDGNSNDEESSSDDDSSSSSSDDSDYSDDESSDHEEPIGRRTRSSVSRKRIRGSARSSISKKYTERPANGIRKKRFIELSDSDSESVHASDIEFIASDSEDE